MKKEWLSVHCSYELADTISRLQQFSFCVHVLLYSLSVLANKQVKIDRLIITLLCRSKPTCWQDFSTASMSYLCFNRSPQSTGINSFYEHLQAYVVFIEFLLKVWQSIVPEIWNVSSCLDNMDCDTCVQNVHLFPPHPHHLTSFLVLR